MFKWKKLGQVFNPTELIESSWMNEYAQAPSIVIFDNYIRVFFSSRQVPDEKGQYISRMGYIDLDINNLFEIINISKEPNLPLGGLGTFDEFGTYPVSVIKTENEIRAYYAGWTRCESVPFNAAIGLAVSINNGESFSKVGEGPIISYTPDEPFVMGSPKIRKFGNSHETLKNFMVTTKSFAKTFLPFAILDKKNVHFCFGSPTFEKHMLKL